MTPPPNTDLISTEQLSTEQPSQQHAQLDEYNTEQLIAAFSADQARAAQAVQKAAAQLTRAVDLAYARLQAGSGRLVYVGAGTSGRLGVLDGVELLPTFSWPPERLVTLIAGGESAMFRAAEGAEDDEALAEADMRAAQLGPNDVLIALAASGTTPYVLTCVRAARSAGALSIGVTNNPGSPLASAVDAPIELDTGPEVISGSTRLKAGTAQKIALNTFSSSLMVQLGKVYGNLMVDLMATNAKLRRRAVRLTQHATGVSETEALSALTASAMHVKTAIVMLKTGLDAQAARERLQAAAGHTKRALKNGGAKSS
ncbi:N-acetylmuramic acid 6-phosphate etherase [Deinococcus detaillensis]|uniref:N-acetylmuramic acid 6-phosphate etherase n=1 Tax=Deinococcus detaillensis TaxID=2592048 RepID=A0A553V4V1_9DEIO|nr:N-acetylmuramic acid 6-phosphate etherase [Deinococcus detaillensis]TSA87485.1 N-acetylmuramic acid 6-phosphate etherase [Deinococcus detaillensis]